MARRPFLVPDAYVQLTFWLGLMAAIVPLSSGLVARAEDLSPWPHWLWIPACWVPFGLLLWLRRKGRVELVDTDAIESERVARALSFVPDRFLGPISVLLMLFGSALDLAQHYPRPVVAWLERFDLGRVVPLAGRDFFFYELVGLAAFFAGAAAAIWETAAVVRAARLKSGNDRKSDRRA